MVQCREEAKEQNVSMGDWDSGIIAYRIKMPGRAFLQDGADCHVPGLGRPCDFLSQPTRQATSHSEST